MNPFAIVGFISVGVMAILAGALWVQTDRLSDRTRERDAAVERLDSAQQAIAELAVENAIANRRDAIVSSGREQAVAAPETDNGPVGKILLDALQTADAIGGVE